MEKVTVFIPLYNAEKWVKRTLASILMQEVSFAYKILIYDDGSTDESVKNICELIEIWENENNIDTDVEIVRSEINGGLYDAVQYAYKNIKSEYFTVLDADDYWITKDKLQEAVDYLEANEECSEYATEYYIEHADNVFTHAEFDHTKDCYHIEDYDYFHTSTSVFRTSAFADLHKEIEEYMLQHEQYLSLKSKPLEGDGFRNFYALSKGYIHYEKKVTSVYNRIEGGYWTRLSEYEKDARNAEFYSIMMDFFNGNKDFFEYFRLRARESYDNALARYYEAFRTLQYDVLPENSLYYPNIKDVKERYSLNLDIIFNTAENLKKWRG